MPQVRRRERVGRDVLAAAVTFALVLSVVYTAGRVALVPMSHWELLALAEGVESDPGLSGFFGELDSVAAPAAVIEISGSVEGRFVLDHADVELQFESLRSEDPDYGPNMPVVLDARYSASGVMLTLIADQVDAGQPRTEGMTIAVSVDGRSFNARPGDCTLELSTSGYDPEKSHSGFMMFWPVFRGHVICIDVPDLRGGEPISFTAVFGHSSPVEH